MGVRVLRPPSLRLPLLLAAVACMQGAQTQVPTPGPPKGYYSLIDTFQVCPTSLGPDVSASLE